MNEPRDARATILNLLTAGEDIASMAENEGNVRQAEALARQAIGYFNAANALLTGFAELHNELIEHPLFIMARKFGRKYQF